MSDWIVKILGGIMIVLSGFLISVSKTKELKKRVEIIDGLISGFVTAEGHICGRLAPADEALFYAAKDASFAKGIFETALGRNGDMRERFSDVKELLCREDAEAVLQYINGICSPDESERRTAFTLLRERLLIQREKAEADCMRFCKLYNTAGVLGGVVIVILLL